MAESGSNEHLRFAHSVFLAQPRKQASRPVSLLDIGADIEFRHLDGKPEFRQAVETFANQGGDYLCAAKMALHADSRDRDFPVEHSLDKLVIAFRFAKSDHVEIVDVEHRRRIRPVRPDKRAVKKSPTALVEQERFVKWFVPHVVFLEDSLVFLQVAVDSRLDVPRNFHAAPLDAPVLVKVIPLDSPHQIVPAKAPSIFPGKPDVFLQFLFAHLSLFRFVFRPLEKVLGNARPEIPLCRFAVPLLYAVLGIPVKGDSRSKGKIVPFERHVHRIAGLEPCRGKILFADGVYPGIGARIPLFVKASGARRHFHVVEKDASLRKAQLERHVVQSIAFLVRKELHPVGLPFGSQRKGCRSLLTIVGHSSLYNRHDNTALVRTCLEGKIVVARVRKKLRWLDLKSPPIPGRLLDRNDRAV